MDTHHPHHHTNALLLHVADAMARQQDDSHFHALRDAAKAEHEQHAAAHAEAHGRHAERMAEEAQPQPAE